MAHLAEGERTERLVNRVLDTPFLSSCSSVFDAFDENALFQREEGAVESITGQKAEFKSVFQRVSKILDCVACQKCKLHAKLSMLGRGWPARAAATEAVRDPFLRTRKMPLWTPSSAGTPTCFSLRSTSLPGSPLASPTTPSALCCGEAGMGRPSPPGS